MRLLPELNNVQINWPNLSKKPFVIVSPNGGPGGDGGDYGPNTPMTSTLGIQEAIDSGAMVYIIPGTYDISNSQLIIPLSHSWGLCSMPPALGFVNSTPISVFSVGAVIKSNTSDWILTNPNAIGWSSSWPSVISDVTFVNYGSTFKGGLNLEYQEVQLKGVVSVVNTAPSVVSGSVGISMGPQGNHFFSVCDALSVTNYDTDIIVARDNITIGFLNLGCGVKMTTALQIGNASNSPFNDAIKIDNIHFKGMGGVGTVTNLIYSPSPLKQSFYIDQIVIEVGNTGVIGCLVNWGGGNSANPHMHIGTVIDYDGSYNSLISCSGTGVYSSLDISNINFRGVAFGYLYSGFTVPTSSGTSHFATNNSPLTLIVRQTGQSQSHLIASGSNFSSAGDFLLSGSDSVIEVPPGWTLWYGATAPTSSQVWACYGRRL